MSGLANCEEVCVGPAIDEITFIGLSTVEGEVEEVEDGRSKYCACWRGFSIGSSIM